ncbi:VanZ family protein [Anaerohalosphaera lusitana]|nr:VanZ family protein [Anaerohalosphaera lusitana]
MSVDLGTFGFDKLLHAGAYFIITLSVLWSFEGRHRLFLTTVACTVASWGAFDELTQPMFGRTTSAGDWLADCVGVGLAVLLYRGIKMISDKQKQQEIDPCEEYIEISVEENKVS